MSSGTLRQKLRSTNEPAEARAFLSLRRQRSHSDDSRKARKENGHKGMPGKKRKTQPNGLSPRSWFDAPRHARRANKDSHRKVSQATTAESGKPLFFTRRARNDSAMTSDDEAYETSRSTLASGPNSRAGSVARIPTTSGQQVVQHKDNIIRESKALIKQNAGMKKELDTLKAALDAKNQALEALRQELSVAKKVNRKQGSQIEKLKLSWKKTDEVITNVQTNLQCQICLELMLKPYALSPCGHVLCQGCLQEWFRTAPDPNGQANVDPTDAVPAIFRRKTCPCCRAHVVSRPLKLYILKSIISAVCPEGEITEISSPATGGANTETASSPSDVLDDPWAGIFPEDVDMSDEDFIDDEDLDNDELEADNWSLSGSESHYGYGSSSDDEDTYTGRYVHPLWQPPIIDIPNTVGYSQHIVRMLRRGATMQMIERFAMTYHPTHGLTALIDESMSVCLGWNIELMPEDEDGEEFMDWIQDDIEARPERWEVQEMPSGSRCFWRLAREGGDEDEDGPIPEWFSDDDERI